MMCDIKHALLQRIEAAEGPDAELIYDVCKAVLPICGSHRYMPIADRRLFRFIEAEAWESAAVALCERVLPGWEWTIAGGNGPLGWAQSKRWDTRHSCVGNSPALALCAAVVRAKIEQEML